MSAPSFPSFPPSFESFPDLEKHEEKESSIRSKEKELPSRVRAKLGKRRGELGPRESDSERKRRKKQQTDSDKKKHDGNFFEAGVPGLYIVDTAGDRMNEVYGKLHAGDIPRYRRMGYGQVLGLPPYLKIIPRNSGGGVIQVGINGRRPGARYVESRFISRNIEQKTRLLLPSSSKHQPDPSSDFISLPSTRTQTVPTDPLSSYRSIETVKSDSDDGTSQSDEEISTDTDEEKTFPQNAHQRLLSTFEATLRENPTSISTWLSLLKHSLADTPLTSKAALNRARAEIKLSILERAMRADPKNNESIELRIKWLDAGSEIWDPEKLEKGWEKAVHELGSQKASVSLKNAIWNEWLRWRTSSVGRRVQGQASIDGVLDDAKRALENVDGDLAKVKVLWRIAVTLKEAGFFERAMALLQAQIEYVFNCPQKLITQSAFTRRRGLEDFWDSELPRIGEPNARGWHSWDEKSVAQTSGEHRSSSQNIIETGSGSDAYSRWAVDELRFDAASSMPKRAIANDDEDPYSTILFADLEPLLTDISSTRSKHLLRLAWLDLMGLHVPGLALGGDAVSCDDTWAYTHLSKRPYLNQLFTRVQNDEPQWDSIAGSIIAREKNYGSVFSCIKEWLWGAFDPMEILNGRLILWDKWDTNIVDADLAHRIFEQLRQRLADPICDDEWDVMYLAFEAVNKGVKSALKLSRTLLSTSRESLQLWAAHIQLQRLRGKDEDARHVFETVLSSSSSQSLWESKLWWEWAEMEWLADKEQAAQLVILRSVGITSAGPANILRAQRILEDKAVSRKDWRDREAWICLRALSDIVFASHSRGLEEAMRRIRNHIKENSLTGTEKESAWTRMLLFAWKHTTVLKRQVRRIELRGLIEEAVIDMEQEGRMNSIILGVFLQTEQGESVWGRVRALTGESGLSGRNQKERRVDSIVKGLARRIWEVWLVNWERRDWREEKERIRDTLSIAVSDPRTRSSPVLWRIYVEFEIECKELEKAKKALFRAISECPLVKELYLLAFTALRAAFKPSELEAWAETMAERGIRLHHGLEEYIGPGAINNQPSPSDDEEDGEDTTLEKEAEEFRRLAPF